MLGSRFARSLLSHDIPDGWSLEPVGAVISSSSYGLSEPGNVDGKVPIVGMKDLVDGRVADDDLTKIEGTLEDFNGHILCQGDLLLNRTNSPDLVGKVGLVERDMGAVYASYLVRLRIDEARADPRFVSYWLNSSTAQRALKRISTRAVSQANINPTEFKRHCPIPLPPLREQRQIAEILRTWDEAIDAASRLIDTKRQRLDSLRLKLLLGNAKVGNFRGDWHMHRLGEVTREITRRNRGSRFGRDSVMAVTKANGIVAMRDQTIGADLSRYKVLPPRGFAYNPMRINVGSIVMSRLDDEVLVSPDYVLFECIERKLDPDFLDHFRRTHFWDHHINVAGSGSVRVRIYYDDLAAIKVRLPDYGEQRAIVEVLNTALEDVRATERHLEALKRQKRGLMQKLLTGEWRVPSETPVA